MKNFRSTLILLALTVAIGGFAIWEFKKSEVEENEKISKDHILREIKSDDVIQFSFKSGPTEYTLKKENGKWTTTTPVEDLGDDEAITSQINSLVTQNAEVIEASDAGGTIDWGQYGLSSPPTTMTFKTATAEATIQVGTVRSYDQGFYVKKNSDNKLYIVASTLEPYLSKTAMDFRSKKMGFAEGDVKVLKYISKDQKKPAVFELNKKDESWTLVQNPKTKIANDTLRDYLSTLSELRGDVIVAEDQSAATLAKFGLNAPTLKIEAAGQKEATTLTFRLQGSDDVYLISSQKKPVYKITKGRYEELLKTIQDLRDKTFAFQFDHSKAASIAIKNAKYKTGLNLKKVNDKWVDSAAKPEEINQDEVKTLMTTLANLQADEFLPAQEKTGAFDTTYTLLLEDNSPLFTLSAGPSKKSRTGVDTYAVKTSLSDEIMLVSKSRIDEITNKNFIVTPASAPTDTKKTE